MSAVRDAINSIRKTLANSISPKPKEETTELSSDLYVVTTHAGKNKDDSTLFAQLEERVTKTVPLSKLEKLYHLDALTFRVINDYIDWMIGPGYFLEGEKETVKQLLEWAKTIKLNRLMEEIVRDSFLAGNAWVELGYTTDEKDITKAQIVNPKYIDYIRDEQTGFVKLEKDGDFTGFVRSGGIYFEKIKWKKNVIEVGEKNIRVRSDGRDRISHFKLWGLGESFLGCTPLESTYRQAIIRLNISRNVGEGAYRSGGLIITVGDENVVPTNEQVDKIAEEFEDIETDNIFTFKGINKIQVERLPSPDLTGSERLLYYYADIMCTGLGKSVSLVMEPPQTGRTAYADVKAIEFEYRVEALQVRLADQILEKIFYKYMDANGIPRENLTAMKFKSKIPATTLAKARRIATLARRALIKYDPELEKHLRQLEDLPTSMLDDMIYEWKKTGKLPEEEPEKEVRERPPEDAEEFMEELTERLRNEM